MYHDNFIRFRKGLRIYLRQQFHRGLHQAEKGIQEVEDHKPQDPKVSEPRIAFQCRKRKTRPIFNFKKTNNDVSNSLAIALYSQ